MRYFRGLLLFFGRVSCILLVLLRQICADFLLFHDLSEQLLVVISASLTKELGKLRTIRGLVENQPVLDLLNEVELFAQLLIDLLVVLRGVQQTGGLEDGVQGDPERVVQEFRDDPGKQRGANFQRWVCIRFNQIHFELVIEHKVVAEDLERV